ncbi:hypothetical protein BHYA_0075g00240 [Botrytis hyacinthi]|uniref:Uncharacterized protein n=1 Tax=Botrytis hyacinthi TaxID=278943 RepID=A0A4Z1GU19_9HELO|nr:hypothetical protein BHYA_0075g00240 [Botrytis hyacinthi]
MASITLERAPPRMDKIMNLAARRVLLVWRRTPTVSVQRDAELPFGDTALEHVRIASPSTAYNAPHWKRQGYLSFLL